MDADTKKWLIVAGGVAAAVSQFWSPGMDYYLPLIGGAVAAIVALLPE